MVAINCDMGEGYGVYRCGDDEAIMPYVDMANVACGFHASDPSVMRRTVRLAKRHGVQVGAHPSYPDRQGFGRRAMAMDPEEITASIIYQAGALSGFLTAEGMRLGYIKAHGALYGQAAGDRDVAAGLAAGAPARGPPQLGMGQT
ncbi:MAG: LamB/YcsF family protein, partial [bacterium]|nr:LamB/YcsF family protein [bacterium]